MSCNLHRASVALPLAAVALLAAAGLCGCGTDALTYQSDEQAWQAARRDAATAVQNAEETSAPATRAQLYAKAEERYKASLEFAKHLENAAPDHIAISYLDLGKLYQDQGKNSEAVAALEEAHKRFKQLDTSSTGSEQMYRNLLRLDRCRSAAMLGQLYAELGQAAKAEEMFKDALVLRDYGVGGGTLLQQVKKDYSSLLDAQGRHTEATQLRLNQTASPLDD